MKDESRSKPDAKKDGTERRADQRTMRSRGMDAAIAYLERQAFMVAASPWSCAAGKVDMIAWDGPDLVLIDVTVRRSGKGKSGEASISQARRKRLSRVARSWLDSNEGSPQQVRFDRITLLVLAEDRALLRHHRNEFTLTV
jgi:putative endonuclease